MPGSVRAQCGRPSRVLSPQPRADAAQTQVRAGRRAVAARTVHVAADQSVNHQKLQLRAEHWEQKKTARVAASLNPSSHTSLLDDCIQFIFCPKGIFFSL